MGSGTTTVGSVKYDASIDLDALKSSLAEADSLVKKSYTNQAAAAKKAAQSTASTSTSTGSIASDAEAHVNSIKQEAQNTAQAISTYSPQIQKQFLAVDRANNQVYSSTVRSSQAIEKYGADSVQATRATGSLSVAVQNQSQVQARLESSLQSVGKTSSSTTSLMQIGFVSAATAAVALGVAIGSNLSGAVARADTVNNFPKVMANFGISADDATAAMKRLVAGVHGLPTSLDNITSLAEAFTPMTNNIGDATTLALAFNDAILAGGAPMDVQTAAMEQFRQALAKGMPQLQDWRSLETAMPAQLQQVGKYLGLGSGELANYANNGQGLYNAMQDGKLSLNDFSDALVQLDQKGNGVLPSFAEQAKNASTGIGTSVTVMGQDIQQGLVNVFNAVGSQNIQQELSVIGNAFTTAFNIIASGIDLIQGLGSWVGPVVNGIGTAIVTFGGLAAAVYVSIKAFAALKVAMTALSGPVGIIIGLLSLVAGLAVGTQFDSMTNSLDDSADSASDLAGSTGDFNLNLQNAASNASDTAKQLAKINDQMNQVRDDYRDSLAKLVQEKNQDVAQLTQQLSDEKKAYDNAYADRLNSFQQESQKETESHTEKVKDIQNQIDFLTKYNNAANKQQLSQLQFSLAQENSQYQQSTDLRQQQFDLETQSAADEYQQQRDEKQKQLDDELTLLENHRNDVLSVQGVMLDDEIDALKKQRDTQLNSLNQQAADILSSNTASGAAAGDAFNDEFTKRMNDLANSMKGIGDTAGTNFWSYFQDTGANISQGWNNVQEYGPFALFGGGSLWTWAGIKKKMNATGSNIGTTGSGGGWAYGGYTGTGDKFEPAGIVHKGEYVLPREQVNQTTGQPNWSTMGGTNQTITVNLSMSGIMTSSKSDERAIATRMAKLINETVTAKTGKAAIVGI